jgi:four helix bundle protein
MKDFRQLKVWEKAHTVTVAVYRATATFPREELFGMTSQMRRCSASIAANIAEGCGRTGNGDFHRFLNIAAGSAVELEYFLLLARDLEFAPTTLYEELQAQVLAIQRMLASLLRKVDGERNNRGRESRRSLS